jgi:hypothetical protein
MKCGWFAIPHVNEWYRALGHFDARGEVECFIDMQIGMAVGCHPGDDREQRQYAPGKDPVTSAMRFIRVR